MRGELEGSTRALDEYASVLRAMGKDKPANKATKRAAKIASAN